MAQKYQKGQVVKQGQGFTATIVGYCHSNYVIVDDTRYSTMSMYTEGEIEELYDVAAKPEGFDDPKAVLTALAMDLASYVRQGGKLPQVVLDSLEDAKRVIQK
jgi:hypothetical protein